MRYLITGASGFIGNALHKKLGGGGGPVRVLVRSPNPDMKGSEMIKGDVTDVQSCKEAVEDIDLVFHCAGTLGGWGKPEKLFWDVNFQGTKNMLEAAKQAKVKGFVHVSSCGIFGPLRDGEVADEGYRYNATNIYERTKMEAEKLALEYSKNGLPVVVVRPEFVYGPGDFHLLPLFKIVKSGKFMFFNGGKSTLHPTYIDDAVDGIILAASNQKAIGETFNIAGPRPVTVRDFITKMAETTGTKVPSMSIPSPIAQAAGLFLDCSWGLFAKPPLSLSQVRYLTENRAFSSSKAQAMLGYDAKVSIRKGMKRTVRWYRQRGLLE